MTDQQLLDAVRDAAVALRDASAAAEDAGLDIGVTIGSATFRSGFTFIKGCAIKVVGTRALSSEHAADAQR